VKEVRGFNTAVVGTPQKAAAGFYPRGWMLAFQPARPLQGGRMGRGAFRMRRTARDGGEAGRAGRHGRRDAGRRLGPTREPTRSRREKSIFHPSSRHRRRPPENARATRRSRAGTRECARIVWTTSSTHQSRRVPSFIHVGTRPIARGPRSSLHSNGLRRWVGFREGAPENARRDRPAARKPGAMCRSTHLSAVLVGSAWRL